jgi:WD40 repeat protein
MRKCFRIIFLFIITTVYAGEPPKIPILCLETGMHTAQIRRIGVAENVLITGSYDKTVRVWDIESGQLKKILRVPVGREYEGRIFAAAISPDAKLTAAGGWTGYEWDNQHVIYIFDTETGNILFRFTGIPNAIRHLAFSKDGRYLAAALFGANGIRVYDMQKRTLAYQDIEYDKASYWAEFDRAGRLLTTSDDGFIRLYDTDFKKIAQQPASGGKEPYSASFSPDGEKIAVGFADSSKADVLSAKDLSHLYSPTTANVNDSLGIVAWSEDGRFLYAGGRYTDAGGTCLIRRWSVGGKGSYSDFPVSDDAIMHILPLKDNRIAFGTGNPAYGILDSDGDKRLFKEAVSADHRGNLSEFMMSADGNTIRFCFDGWGKRPTVFSVSSGILAESEEKAGLFSPITEGLEISDWKNTDSPKLNEKPLGLDPNEFSRSLAISPDNNFFLLGTDWAIRLFDAEGNLRWTTPAPGAALCVNISANGRIAAAAIGDGTIRWYRMTDGKEILSLFAHKNGRHRILWTPSGYYTASAGADNLLGWLINTGKDAAPDFFPVSRFRSTHCRADIVRNMLVFRDETAVVRLANETLGKKQEEIPVQFMLPPIITIVSPKDGEFFSERKMLVKYAVKSPSDAPAANIRVLINGRFVKNAEPSRSGTEVFLPDQDCHVSVIAQNRYGSSEPASVKLRRKGKTPLSDEFKPNLYAVAMGREAKNFIRLLERQKGKYYRNVFVKVLADTAGSDILVRLNQIRKMATDTDFIIVFFSGHAADAPYLQIREILAAMSGRTAYFLNIPYSENSTDAMANDLSAPENGVSVFVAVGNQPSFEDTGWEITQPKTAPDFPIPR